MLIGQILVIRKDMLTISKDILIKIEFVLTHKVCAIKGLKMDHFSYNT